jgi:hypothetical protein
MGSSRIMLNVGVEQHSAPELSSIHVDALVQEAECSNRVPTCFGVWFPELASILDYEHFLDV